MKQRFLVVCPLVVFAFGCATTQTPVTSSAKLSGATMRSSHQYQADFLAEANKNDAYRHVLFTGAQSQLSTMTIPPGGDVGLESHAHVEVVLFIVEGEGTAIVHGIESAVHAGTVLVAAANTTHNIINTGTEPLRLLTVSSPPNHLDGRLQVTKGDAQRDTADREFGENLENTSFRESPTLSSVRSRSEAR